MEKLLFGVGTSDHQCEAFDPRWPDCVDNWEQDPNNAAVPRCNATDFWIRYEEDVKLAAALGCKLFRFSISWARVEPSKDHFDSDNLKHYSDLVDVIKVNGMEPVVTLLHGAWPLWVEDDDGLYGNDFPDEFAGYVQAVADRIGKKVNYWITINEPDMLPFCYLKLPWAPRFSRAPGLRSGNLFTELDAVAGLCRNLFLANKLAYDILHKENDRAQVSANPYILGVPRWWQRLTTRGMLRERHAHPAHRVGVRHRRLHAARHRLRARWEQLLGTWWVLNGYWWQMGMLGRLNHELCPPGCEGKQDFVSFDYYWGVSGRRNFRKLPALVNGRYEDGPVHPDGLYDLLAFHAKLFPKKPIWLGENGCVERADGLDRPAYLEKHLQQVRKAMKERIPVEAYICWSITTNREWGLPARPGTDFGLYRVDLADPDLKREEGRAAIAYRDLIAKW
jgi:beta-glucosidase/6-phospho-beta-glucosidase/beta-galactosidase